jgi:hypothetical protein
VKRRRDGNRSSILALDVVEIRGRSTGGRG